MFNVCKKYVISVLGSKMTTVFFIVIDMTASKSHMMYKVSNE
jgi:hypothetical protein